MRTYFLHSKPYFRVTITSKRCAVVKGIFFLLILQLFYIASQAQLQYTAAKAQGIAGTYTDLGSSGTVISTANFDNANSSVQNIGFTFYYNGINTFICHQLLCVDFGIEQYACAF